MKVNWNTINKRFFIEILFKICNINKISVNERICMSILRLIKGFLPTHYLTDKGKETRRYDNWCSGCFLESTLFWSPWIDVQSVFDCSFLLKHAIGGTRH